MKKYIRTKDGRIIDISDIELFEDELANTDFDDVNICLYAGIPVIKSTNTIKELCDAFVVIGRKDSYIARTIYNEFDKELFIDLKCKVSGFEIYGAIWTDKGLKFVARVNSKGELELL